MLSVWETWIAEREDSPSFVTMEEKSDEGKVVFGVSDLTEFVIKGPCHTGDEMIKWLFEVCDKTKASNKADYQNQWIEEVNNEISLNNDAEEKPSTIFEIITKKYEKIYEGVESESGGWSDDEDLDLHRADSEDKVNQIMGTLSLRETYVLQNKSSTELANSLAITHEIVQLEINKKDSGVKSVHWHPEMALLFISFNLRQVGII